MAQFFNQNVDAQAQVSANDYKGLQDLANNAYDTEQKRKLNEVFSKSIDDSGNPNEVQFYKGVRENGLNPDAAKQILAYHQSQKAQEVADAQQNLQLRQAGVDPNAGGRNGASIGAPQPQTVANPNYVAPENQPAPQPQQAPAQAVAPASTQAPQPLTPASFADYFQDLKNKASVARQQLGVAPTTTMNTDGTTNTPSTATPDTTAVQGNLNSQALGGFLGVNGGSNQTQNAQQIALAKFLGMQPQDQSTPADQVDVHGENQTADNSGTFTTQDPTAVKSPTTLVPGVDTRSARQKVEDSYNPDNSIYNPTNGSASKSISDPSLLVWNPTNDGSDRYKQYATTLQSEMNANGFKDANDFLAKTYAVTLKTNMPVAPVRAAYPPTVEGNAKYVEATTKYQTEKQQAEGKAEQAVMNARTTLSKEASERGVQATTQDQLKLSTDANSRADKTLDKDLSQASHPAIKGYLPNPSEKVALSDASGAVRSMQDAIKNPPSPNSSEWQSFKLILAKDLVKAYSLPVGEGLLNEVSGMVNNGFSVSDAIGKVVKDGKMESGVASAVGQAFSAAAGVNDIGGAKYLTEKASEFARNRWSAYGKGDQFDTYFPDYKAGAKETDKPTGPSNPKDVITYVKGMRTLKGKWYNVGGQILEGKN